MFFTNKKVEIGGAGHISLLLKSAVFQGMDP